MNRKKILMLVAIVVMLAASAVIFMWPEPKGPRVDYSLLEVAEAAYERQDYAEAENYFQQTLDNTSDSEVANRARFMIRLTRGHVTIAELRQLIYQEEKYGQALPLLQDAIRQFGSDRDLAAELARLRITVVVADSIDRADKKYSSPILMVNEEELRQARDELSTVVDRHRENKENGYLEGLRTLDSARERLNVRLREASTRLASLNAAKNDWDDVIASRQAKRWKEEIEALEEMLGHPEDLVLSLTNGRDADYLLENARVFQSAFNAFSQERYDDARDLFGKVDRDDYHYMTARDYLQEIAANAEYFKSLKLYREGRPAEAAGTLVRIRMEDPKFGVLYDLAVDRQERLESLEQFQQQRNWTQLRDKSTEFKNLLERPRDNFYAQVVERSLELARQRIYETERKALWDQRQGTLENLRWSFSQKNYARVIGMGRELLILVTEERFDDLVGEVDTLLTQAEDIVLAESKAWLPQGMVKLREYVANPLNETDRRSEMNEEIRNKITLLADLYNNSINALMGARQLPPERVAEVEQINRYVMEEILHQQEVLFNIRETYERLGNMSAMKTAEAKIVLLPDIEGSNWRKRIRSNNPDVIDLSKK